MYLSNEHDKKAVKVMLPIISIIIVSPIFLRLFEINSNQYLNFKWYKYTLLISLAVMIILLLPCYVSRIPVERFIRSPYISYIFTILFIGIGYHFIAFYYDNFKTFNILITISSFSISSILIENNYCFKNSNRFHQIVASILRLFSRYSLLQSIASIYVEFIL